MKKSAAFYLGLLSLADFVTLFALTFEQNNEGAPMDIDEDETQRAIEVKDYGIEVDFSDLDDDERAVS